MIARLLNLGGRERAATRRPARRAPPSAWSSARSRSSSGCSTRTPRRCWCRPRTCGCSSARRRPGCAGSGAGSRSAAGWCCRSPCSWRRWTRSGSGRSRSRGCGCSRPPAGTSRRGRRWRSARSPAASRARAGAARAPPPRRRRAAGRAPEDARPRQLRRTGLARRHGVGPAPLMAATEAPPRRRRRGLRALATLLIVAGAARARRRGGHARLAGAADRRVRGWRQRGLEDRLAELERAPLPAQERRVLAKVPDPRRRLALDARALGRRAAPATRSAGCGSPPSGCAPSSSRGRTRTSCATGPATTRTPSCPASAARSRSRATGRPTARRSGGRRARPRRPDRRRHAVRVVHLPGRRHADRARTAVGVVGDKAYDRLVLTACHPLFSAGERIVVSARLERAVPA